MRARSSDIAPPVFLSAAPQALAVKDYIKKYAGRAPWPPANTTYFTPSGRAYPDLVGDTAADWAGR